MARTRPSRPPSAVLGEALLPSPQKGLPFTGSASLRRAGTLTSSPAGRRRLAFDEEFDFLNVEQPSSALSSTSHCRVLVPAWETINDASRIRNGGKSLQPRLTGFLLQHAASAPEFQHLVKSHERPRTPRSMRGLTKSISQVDLQYPGLDPLSPHRRHMRRTYSPPPIKRSTTMKTTWADVPIQNDQLQNVTSSSTQGGVLSEALERSLKKMDGLQSLRRVNAKDASVPLSPDAKETEQTTAEVLLPTTPASRRATRSAPSTPAAQPLVEQNDEGSEEDLLHGTLKDLEDTSTSLKEKATEIEMIQAVIGRFGGSRHATNVQSIRTLAVVKRKALLLGEVEQRTAEFEAGHARKEEILQDIISGKEEVPKELSGIRQFINSYVNKPCEPVDSDRSDFGAFVSTVKLPSKHLALEHLRRLGLEIGSWWAHTANNEAEKGAQAGALRALMNVALAAGCDPKHPYLFRADEKLKDRLADRVLEHARAAKKKDDMAGAKGTAMIGMASKAADTIDGEIKDVVKQGVLDQDSRLQDARKIAKELRDADGNRKRMANREERLKKEKQGG